MKEEKEKRIFKKMKIKEEQFDKENIKRFIPET